MKKTKLTAVSVPIVAFAFAALFLAGLSLAGCKDPNDSIDNQTPVASDYNIGNLSQTAGNVSAVTITPKPGKSTGAITIFYTGTGSTTYLRSRTIPKTAGAYTVTFDVAEASGWNAAAGLSAGTLTITAANQTPTAADYTIGNLTQTVGSVSAVTITAKPGKSNGAITIYYNGSTTLPTTAGTYAVTFNVAAASGWNAATSLSAGNLVIGSLTNQTPIASDYDISGTGTFTYDGSAKTVSVTAKSGKSTGAVTVKYNNSTAAPAAAGTYTVTFDVAASSGWNAASGLSAGTLTINNATPAIADYDFGNLTQIARDVTAVTITAKQGKSTGAVTIYYNGSTTLPTAVGTYAVTFDVAAVTNWNAVTGLNAENLIIGNPANKTPSAADYDISGTGSFIYDGSARTVTVTAKSGKSEGAVTVKYNNSTTAPSAAGTYTVTFDVAAVSGWNAASGLSAGNLIINNPTPTADDYEISGTGTFTYDGSGKTVTVTAKSGKSTGAVTVKYNNSTAVPTAARTYTVTFDVAAVTGWNAATGLSAGTLTINAATPAADDFTISGLTQTYDGSAKTVTVTANTGKTTGNRTVKYNGSTTAPSAAGTYTVTFDVAAATNWNAVIGLSAGMLTISNATPAADDFTIIGLSQTYIGSARTVTVKPKSGKTTGTVTVKYNGSTTAPTAVGTYTVTFDVAAATNWNAATDLSAGTLRINEATPWARTVSGGSSDSLFNAVAKDAEGNVYAAGYQTGTGTYTYGEGVYAKATLNNVALEKFVEVVGTVSYLNDYMRNSVLVKYDSSGVAQWAKTVNDGWMTGFTAVAVDSSGNVYAAGYQNLISSFTVVEEISASYGEGVSAQGSGVVLVKYNSSGTAQWAKTISVGGIFSQFTAVAVDSLGNVYAAGYQMGDGMFTYGTGVSAQGTATGSKYNVVLVKYDSSGAAQWAKTVSAGSDESQFSGVAVDSSGNVYAAGYQKGNGVYTYGSGVSVQGTASDSYNVVLVKYDSSGAAQWAKTVSAGNNSSKFNAVAVDSSGGVYAAGSQTGTGIFTYGPGVSAQAGGGINVVLVKYDSSGAAQWARTTPSSEYASRFIAVTVDSSGNVYAAGSQLSTGIYTYGTGVTAQGTASDKYNVVLVKYNSSGTAQWAKTVIAGNNESVFNAVAVDSSGGVYAAGSQRGNGTYTYGTGVSAQGTATGIYENAVLVKYKD